MRTLEIMSYWITLPLIVAFGFSVVISSYVERRNRREGRELEPKINPLNGTRDSIPPQHRAQERILYSVFAGSLALVYILRHQYLASSVFVVYAMIGLYQVWVYRRGREPKIMEGFREIPDPPSLLGPR